MKLVFDMNLSSNWVPLLSSHGFDAVHWSQVGAQDATDETIMR